MEIRSRRVQKRKRNACDSCFRKKIKCSQSSSQSGSQCEWCSEQGIPCTFTRFLSDSKTHRDINNNPSIVPPPQASPSDIDIPNSARRFSSDIPKNVRSFSGLPFFSTESQKWISARTGQDVDLLRLCSRGPPWQRQGCSGAEDTRTFFQEHSHVELPDRQILGECLEMFRSSFHCLMFPIIDVDMFAYTIDAAYNHKTSPYSPDITSARACVFAFVAFAARDGGFGPVSERYTYEAQSLVPDILQGMATIDAIQALLILSVQRMMLFGDAFSVDPLLSTAARFIFLLGGHEDLQTHDNNPPPSTFRLRCRILFWSTYAVDKELCLRTGRPPHFSDEQCDLTLPRKRDLAEELGAGNLGMDNSSSPDHLHLTFPTDLRVSIIQSRIYNELWSTNARRKSYAELLKTIRELDVEVERWRAKLPAADEPIVCEAPIKPSQVMRRRLGLLHFQYHYCVAGIHQTSTGCAGWIHDQNEQLPGITSSLMVAAQASRTLLRSFLEERAIMGVGSFWFNSFYIVSGSITLFCNILKNPLAASVADDILILWDTSIATTDIYQQPEAQADRAVTRQFIMELHRLAGCAVQQAQTLGRNISNRHIQ